MGLTWSRFQFITLNSSQLFLFVFWLSALTFSSRLSCKATLSFLLRIYYTITRLCRFLQRSYIQVKTHLTITNSPFQFFFFFLLTFLVFYYSWIWITDGILWIRFTFWTKGGVFIFLLSLILLTMNRRI